jgi:hypothetical protein
LPERCGTAGPGNGGLGRSGEREGSAFGQAEDNGLFPGSARCALWELAGALCVWWSGDDRRRSATAVGRSGRLDGRRAGRCGVLPGLSHPKAITAAADPGREGAEHVYAVRPVRIDARTVAVPVRVAGRLVMAAAQAGKYAALNGDGRTASHALDLASEIGAALSSVGTGDEAETPVGVLTELASTTETVAVRVESDGWSICPCGEQHDQDEVDAGMPATLRADAALARRWSQQ